MTTGRMAPADRKNTTCPTGAPIANPTNQRRHHGKERRRCELEQNALQNAELSVWRCGHGSWSNGLRKDAWTFEHTVSCTAIVVPPQWERPLGVFWRRPLTFADGNVT